MTTMQIPERSARASRRTAPCPRTWLRIVALALFLPSLAIAQFGSDRTSQQGGGSQSRGSAGRGGTQDLPQMKLDTDTRIAVIPMDGPVDPAVYVLGPNDIITVSVWGPVSFTLPLVVSPEGSLIIPTVGEVPVTGRTLSAAKTEVTRRVRSRYTMGDITVTLTSPRAFTVSLRGSVLMPGTYTATAVDRVEKIVRLGATIPTPTATMSLPPTMLQEVRPGEELRVPKIQQTAALYEKASTRNILVVRRTRDTVRVDLAMFEATGDEKYNPYLRDGDMVFVPQRGIEHNFVAVHGAVNMPGQVEFVEGDRLGDLLRIAHGLTPDALGTAVISRIDATGRLRDEQQVDARAILAGTAPDPLLQRGDQVVVRGSGDIRGEYFVTLQGEVTSPGTYPISRGTTKLSEVLRAAGGLTDRALPAASVLFRKIDRVEKGVTPLFEMARTWRAAQFNIVDSTYAIQMMKEGRAPVNVAFDKILAGDVSADVVLEHDDILAVASDRKTVLVDGQVAHAGYVPWVPGASLEHYLRAAGGTTEMAIEGDIRVVKRGSLEWVDADDTVIESGDKIWVPKKIPKDLSYYLAIFRDAATFMTAIATVGILIYQIQNNK